jgi:hypothetical protein
MERLDLRELMNLFGGAPVGKTARGVQIGSVKTFVFTRGKVELRSWRSKLMLWKSTVRKAGHLAIFSPDATAGEFGHNNLTVAHRSTRFAIGCLCF